jgi:hypothetical protein
MSDTQKQNKKAEPSLSQQRVLRDAKKQAEKKMTPEKAQRLKRAGVVK